MAKMKIHELAKEINVPSKDILTLLQDKGIDVKNHMSTIEDDSIDFVKNKMGKQEKTAVTPTEKVPVNTEKQTAQEAQSQTEPPKKKKSGIIFVSNPQNSKMPGSSIPKQMQKPKPVEKPVQPTRPTIILERPSAAPEVNIRPQVQESASQAKAEEKAAQKAAQQTTQTAAQLVAQPVQQPAQPVVQETAQTAEQKTAQPAVQTPAQATADKETRPGNSADTYTKAPARTGENSRNTERSSERTYTSSQNGQRSDYRNNTNQGGQRSDYRSSNYSGQGGQRPDYRNSNYSGQNGQRSDYRSNNYSGQSGQSSQRPDYRSNNYNNQGGQGGQRPNYRNNNYSGQGGQRPDYRNNGQGGQRPDYRNNGGQGGYRNNNSQFFDKDADMSKGDRQGGNRFSKPGMKTAGGAATGASLLQNAKHRDEVQRRLNQEKDKKNRKEFIYEEEKEESLTKNKAGRFIKPEKKPEVQEEVIKVITLPDTLTIKELAEKMKLQPSAIVKKLFLQGQIVTVNQEISYEQAEEIAIDYEIICEKEVKVDVIEELLKEDVEEEDNLTSRPPVICVMGHVDHGKTSLLDAIRKTNVTDREAGGITQHIGAYTVDVNGKKITFLDTPGHEAFTAMRMRGANATDIAILVVAADDGVMPQTIEAINHAKAAGIEIIVAVNKIDKPNANLDRVKQELTEYELVAEDWGGSTVFAPVSAKTGQGIPELLEMILLTADILELKANATRRARGLVIEAELDKGRGPIATVLVQKGTLHVGDFISAGASHGKVRAMIDDKGRRIKEATPSTPVEILGLDDVPNAGEVFISHENDKEAKSFADTFIAQNKVKLLDDTKAKMSLDDLFTQIKAGNLKELNLIVKADVQGSVEAVNTSLLKLSNDEVVVKVIHSGVGAINESDVILASASNAIIIGFNVRPDVQAKSTGEREGVDIRLYKVIYQAIEDVQAAMKGMLDPVFEEKIIGHAEVRQIFKASAVGNIAGSYVLDGTFQRNCKVRITREGTQIFEGALESLKRFKDDVKEVKAGFECGLVFDGFDQFQELDIVEAYIMVEVPR